MSTQIIRHEIKFKRHEGQALFHASKARFRILACGRRWGKTKVGAVEFILMLMSKPEESVGYAVAPTFKNHTRKQWKEILRYCPKTLIQLDDSGKPMIDKSAHIITLLGNREIQFKSADSEDSMRGESVAIAWVDEGGQIAEDRWTMELRPSLMDTKGECIFTGTPKGKNWYFALWTRGQDQTQRKDYESWAFSSYTNPYIDSKEIDEFKRDMPELAFRQEILAEFLDDVGSVFRGIRNCIGGSLEEPQTNKRYVAGCDLAKHTDFTVLIILDQNGHVCFFNRFSQLDWVFQSKRIIDICRRYNNARLLLDSTGIGDPIYDNLRRSGLSVEGYKFTNASKKDLIENLSIQIENKQITYPDIPVLISELGLYGYKISPAGVTSYNAPEGYHDDTVIALALACWQTSKPKGFFGSAGVH